MFHNYIKSEGLSSRSHLLHVLPIFIEFPEKWFPKIWPSHHQLFINYVNQIHWKSEFKLLWAQFYSKNFISVHV